MGYSEKRTALEKLKNNFEEGIEFLDKGTKTPVGGGRPSQHIRLTTDCFKQFCMMADTEQGKEIRKYFIQCEQELKQIKSRPQPQPQTNADPFIQMIEQDLEQVGVATAFIKGWKYDALKALHPDRA